VLSIPIEDIMPNKQKITGTDACVMMHTALRKCCDSSVTSAMYNVIHIIDIPEPINPWIMLGNLVAAHIDEPAGRKSSGRSRGEAALRKAASELDKEFYDQVAKMKREEIVVPSNAAPSMYTLTCLFRLFSEEDWAGMGAYLDE
jgi:hypothetical protein